MFDLLKMWGGCGKYKNGTYTVLIRTVLPPNLTPRLQNNARVYCAGAVLARYGEVSFPHPGGCVIGLVR